MNEGILLQILHDAKVETLVAQNKVKELEQVNTNLQEQINSLNLKIDEVQQELADYKEVVEQS